MQTENIVTKVKELKKIAIQSWDLIQIYTAQISIVEIIGICHKKIKEDSTLKNEMLEQINVLRKLEHIIENRLSSIKDCEDRLNFNFKKSAKKYLTSREYEDILQRSIPKKYPEFADAVSFEDDDLIF